MPMPRVASPVLRSLLTAGLLVTLLVTLGAFANQEPEHFTGRSKWLSWGGNLHNTHQADTEQSITPSNVGRLKPKWIYETAGNVTAIPTVSDGVVYVPDWGIPLVGGGKLHAIEASSGRTIWSKPIVEYTGNLLNTVSRSSPAIASDRIV